MFWTTTELVDINIYEKDGLTKVVDGYLTPASRKVFISFHINPLIPSNVRHKSASKLGLSNKHQMF